MKILSQNDQDRLRDKSDIAYLLSEASDFELAETKIALELIEKRGFSRGKNLLLEFEMAIKTYSKVK